MVPAVVSLPPARRGLLPRQPERGGGAAPARRLLRGRHHLRPVREQTGQRRPQQAAAVRAGRHEAVVATEQAEVARAKGGRRREAALQVQFPSDAHMYRLA